MTAADDRALEFIERLRTAVVEMTPRLAPRNQDILIAFDLHARECETEIRRILGEFPADAGEMADRLAGVILAVLLEAPFAPDLARALSPLLERSKTALASLRATVDRSRRDGDG